MSWNYRIVKYHAPTPAGPTHGLHEVYYDEEGVAWGMTEHAASFTGGCHDDDPEVRGDGRQEVLEALADALHNAVSRPVFEEPEHWAGKSPVEGVEALKEDIKNFGEAGGG